MYSTTIQYMIRYYSKWGGEPYTVGTRVYLNINLKRIQWQLICKVYSAWLYTVSCMLSHLFFLIILWIGIAFCFTNEETET